jgi:hypothetical protein
LDLHESALFFVAHLSTHAASEQFLDFAGRISTFFIPPPLLSISF